MKKSILLALEGPDQCGKTQIAADLSRQLGIPVFKNSGEWFTDLRDPSYFKNLLTYGATFLADFLCQTRASAIMDRNYASEWVYSRHFGRATDERVLRKVDEKFAEAGGKIVICRRKSYNGIRDDLHSYIDSHELKGLDSLYQEFEKWTACEVLTIWVDDENLERETLEIREWLKV
jgi:thymidylate kinase